MTVLSGAVLKIKPKTFHIPGKLSQLHPQPRKKVVFQKINGRQIALSGDGGLYTRKSLLISLLRAILREVRVRLALESEEHG